MTAADHELDAAIADAVHVTAGGLADTAEAVGAWKIGERKYMQPALHQALTDLLGTAVHRSEPQLRFVHWLGQLPKRLGGIDIAVHRKDGSGCRAFMELKWGDPDWMILDFYKMTTGRISPGADSCYLIAGQRLTEWAKPDTVCELFRTERWRSENVLLRHYEAFRGDESEYGKLTHLPPYIHTTLVADETLPAPLHTWAIKAIRVEPDPREDTDWLHIQNGKIVSAT